MPDQEQSRIQRILHSPRFYIIASIVFVVGVIVASVILSLFSKDSETYSIPVTNFSDSFPDLDETMSQELEDILYTQAAKDVEKIPSKTAAVIREDSLNAINYNRYHTGEFIIDIPKLKLSYLVSFQYGVFMGSQIESIAFATFYCLPEDKLIYPAFECSAENISEYTLPTISSLKMAESAYSGVNNL